MEWSIKLTLPFISFTICNKIDAGVYSLKKTTKPSINSKSRVVPILLSLSQNFEFEVFIGNRSKS